MYSNPLACELENKALKSLIPSFPVCDLDLIAERALLRFGGFLFLPRGSRKSGILKEVLNRESDGMKEIA